MTVSWHRFFTTDRILSMRRGRGERDLCLVVEDTEQGPTLARWDAKRGSGLPLSGDFGDPGEAVLSADGEWVLSLHDDNGSEVGHVWATSVDGADRRDLTPALAPYTLRGIDTARHGDGAVITVAAPDGFSLWHVHSSGTPAPSRLFTSPHEAWNGLISADGRIASVDTTDHNPGVRRFAVTVVTTGTGEVLGCLTDGPKAPVRAVRFSPVDGDGRLLVSTERTGFARPCVWDPADGSRIDVDAPHLHGDLVALDWSDDASRILLVHVDDGLHHVMEFDLRSRALTAVPHPAGAYFEPDVAAAHLNQWASHYAADGRIRLLHQRFDQPLTILHVDCSTGGIPTADLPTPVPSGVRATSLTVHSTDGTPLQLWVCRPPHAEGPLPLVLNLHGGPNLVSVDSYNPQAQAWVASGVAYASLNYRGSVTFGRRFREGFLGSIGDRELEDIESAVRRLTADGVADAGRIFITGASYGGFLSLLSVGRLPHLFAGAMAFVPMADWVTAYDDMNPALRAAWKAFFGAAPDLDPDRYRRASPITYVGSVRAPVWIMQATHDTRTPPKQAYAYAQALQRAGGDVRIDWFSGGHETSSRRQEIDDQQRMTDLVQAALRGESWSRGPVEPPSGQGPA
ncbi:prolyl oligopeptidase family serine peptidase [Embleya scabrispora]|uniref:prolyl oligopeptidase family serine peptidase n=1 Tax=Embleya scabrispora TaxID=159449 RepID=UPI00036F5415|nr:prolyl oligopeptidase family serine peptidase [Embleya scabrispora]MYS86216.1 prolyl oligopeptidase family serine peptidase [Streptomyces sp. SID5474]